MNHINRFLFAATAMVLLLACSKEYSLETGGSGNPGGGGNTADYRWSFTGNSTENYQGCIDTAYYQAIQGLKGVIVQGTDSVGNNFLIVFRPASGVIAPGSYGVNNGAVLTIIDQNGETFLPKPPAPFTLQIVAVNDTLIEGKFSGTLSNMTGTTTFTVSNGAFKALIGKENPCGGSDPGSTDAEFTLASTGGNCAAPLIDGNFFQGVPLDEFSTIELDVDVAVAGDWTVATVPVNGMSFSGFGTFAATGAQTVILEASGTPISTGNFVIPVQAGGSTCNVTVRVDATTTAVQGNSDYFPTTTNSSWIYHVRQLTEEVSDSTEVRNGGATRVVNNQTYNQFNNDLFGLVYRKANGNYYRYGSVDIFGFIDTSFKAETIFLKDNVPVGATWESPEFSTTSGTNAIKFKRVFTITAKGTPLTVRGVVYSDVITVKEELMAQIQNFPYQAAEETFVSYAKGVGLIQVFNPEFKLKIDVKRYQIF